jgi:hypothetical protein
VVVDRHAVCPEQPSAAGKQPTFSVRRRGGITQGRPPAQAACATATRRNERQYDPVADHDVHNGVTHGLHYSGGFMAQRHRKGSWARSIHDRQIGVAQPGCVDFHQQLARLRICELQPLKHQRLVRPRHTRSRQNRSNDVDHVHHLDSADDIWNHN